MDKIFDPILSWTQEGANRNYLVTPRTVFDFFTNGRNILRIPDYQRPYSWSIKNIQDLLMDIKKVSTKGNNSSWFLGPLFTVRKASDDLYIDLLDGQQRTTTLQIILREASLIMEEEEGIDISSDKELFKKVNKALDRCKRCLVKEEGMSETPVFETEESIKEIFQSYIMGFSEIESFHELKDKREIFNNKIEKARKDGSITAGTIIKSVNYIREFIKSEFMKNERNTIENMEYFYEFLNTLLNKLWLIEIPLQGHDDSVQIFESLNNRGKQLTLVDKLRYKSIVKASSDYINDIRLKWKKVYSGINHLIDDKYVKSEDDFYKVFFNSLQGKDIGKEEEFLDIFSETFLISDDKILEFLDRTVDICDFFRILSSSLDEKNDFLNYFDNQEKAKVKSLLQLLRRALKISDNSRFLLFHVLIKNHNYSLNKYIIIQSIWNIIRYVFFEEIYQGRKSNAVRILYMEKIKKSSSSPNNCLSNASPILEYKTGKSIQNLIKTTNNEEAKFIIYLYTYITDYKSLTTHSPSQYKKSELDHLFPRAWKTNWNDKKYNTQEVIDFINALSLERPALFQRINLEQFKIEIQNSDYFELLDYNSRPNFQEESLIEFIGNKWVLHSGTNASSGNYAYSKKLELYKEDKWIKIPANTDEIGILKYEDFAYREIITRSLIIADTLIKNFKTTWDSI